MIVAITSTYWIAIIFPPIFYACILLVRYTVKALRETSRLFSTSKSPLLSFLGETITGASTIRAFKKTKEF